METLSKGKVSKWLAFYTLSVKHTRGILFVCLQMCSFAHTAQNPKDQIKAQNHTTQGWNEATLNHLSFLLSTQHYRWSPKESYSIRSERKGFMLEMLLRYPDSTVFYNLNSPRLMELITKKDTLHGLAGHLFSMTMADSVMVEYSGPVIQKIKTDTLSFFVTGAKTSERLQTILQTMCRDNHRRWYLEDERRKETTICPPKQH